MSLLEEIGAVMTQYGWAPDGWDGGVIDTVPKALSYAMKKLQTREGRQSSMDTAKSLVGRTTGGAAAVTLGVAGLVGGMAAPLVHPQGGAALIGLMAEVAGDVVDHGYQGGRWVGRRAVDGAGKTGRGMKSVYKQASKTKGQHRSQAAVVLVDAAWGCFLKVPNPTPNTHIAAKRVVEYIVGGSAALDGHFRSGNGHAAVVPRVEAAIKSTNDG